MPSVASRRRRLDRVVRHLCERLESRRLLCSPLDSPADIARNHPPGQVLDTPEEIAAFLADAVSPQVTASGPEVAPVVWVNRGVTSGLSDDRFDDVFGAGAEAARQVFDAAITMWARVIGDFNYLWPFAGATYQLQVRMADSGTGNGASASVSSWAYTKPIAGSITMGRGGGGTGGGWFIDPTPYDNGEFMGTIENAFAGGAQSGSPAAGKGDFLTVALAELAHCFGLYWAPSGFQSFTADTDINDAAGGGTGADLFVFDSPNIDHLVTELDSGLGATGSAIHTAEPQTPIAFSGRSWTGTDDAGNAYYEFSQRCLVPENLRLIFDDSLFYSTVPAAQWGTFYATVADGVLRVRGSEEIDTIVISASGSDILVSVDPVSDVGGSGALSGFGNLPAWVSRFSSGSISGIVVDGYGGTDYIRLEGNLFRSTTLRGGGGDDFIDFSFYGGNLDAITGATAVDGGSGTDQVFVYDNVNSAAHAFTITEERFDRPNWSGFFYSSTVEALTLTTGTGNNTVNILSTYPNQPVFLQNAGGAETVNIGGPGGVQLIRAALQVQNNPNYTTINIDDGLDATGRSVTVDVNGDFASVSGLAPAPIYWDTADVNTVNLITGSGVDAINVLRLRENLGINTTGGNDAITAGAVSVGGVSGITGQLTIDNSPAYSTVTIDDAGNATARSISVDEIGGYNTVSGIAPGQIRFDSVDVSSALLRSGWGADTVAVLRNDETLDISSSSGADTVRLGNGTDGVAFITGTLTITDPPNFSTILVDDTGNTTPRSITHDTVVIGGSNFGLIAGIAPAWIYYRYGDTDKITITTGAGTDLVAVWRSGAHTTFNSAGGMDVVNVGNATDGVQSIHATLQIRNTPNFTQLMLDNSADTTARTATIEDYVDGSDHFGRITGLAPSEINYRVIDVLTAPTVRGGSGDDTFYLRSLDAARGLVLEGSDGADAFLLGSGTNQVEPINGLTTVSGGAGSDLLTFNDQGELAPLGFTVTATTVNRHAMGQVAYAALEAVVIDCSGGVGRTHTVNGTAAGTPVTLATGPGTDSILVNETSLTGAVVLPGSTGDDLVSINGDDSGGALAVFSLTQRVGSLSIGAGGKGMLRSGGSTVLTASSLALQPAGTLDVTDGAVILDYTGSSPAPAIRAALVSGFAGGMWSGAGIMSSKAAATPNRTLGYAEATDLFSAFPTAFAGQAVDNSSLLIRYTLPGDTDLDRDVDIADFARLATNFNQSTASWSRGDLNYDGATTIADFSALASNFNGSLPASVPTPVPGVRGIGERRGSDSRGPVWAGPPGIEPAGFPGSWWSGVLGTLNDHLRRL